MASVIGYAQANFATLIADKNVYIDRTAYIRTIENQSNRNLIFVRPRRFGKSLWLSMMYYYYGVEHKEAFDTLFGHLDIGKNPTPLRNSFLILRFQFAGIDVETDASTYSGFRQNVLVGILNCMKSYPAYFSEEEMNKIEGLDIPANMIQMFFSLYSGKNIPHKIYILIDEYDQFTNELVGLDTERFRAIVGRSGYVRKYYEMIKNAIYEGGVNRCNGRFSFNR
jgi:Predicted AAA-ATPase